MRIGILTASKTNNNGTDLQAFAMQKLFSSLGHNAEIIDYGCIKLNSSKHFLEIHSLKDIIRLPWAIYMEVSHEKFRKKYFIRSRYMEPERIDLSCYDAVVVGSDQIWNLTITGYDMNFFLPESLGSFKRMSYAASLGKSDISEWEKEFHISSLLQNFNMISVREKSGVDALRQINICAREDLDPIIMAGKDTLTSLIKKHSCNSKYVVLYLVEENKQALKDAIRYAKMHACKVYMITGITKHIPNVKSKWFVSLQKWLLFMNEAEIVFTNSYHGVSTSITLNTEFRAYPLKSEDGNLRVMSLLEKTGMREFYVDYTYAHVFHNPDWREINKQVEYLRNVSRENLRLALKEN